MSVTLHIKKRTNSRERGSALIEFVLCTALFWLPLFLGTLIIGFNLIRAIQVTQVCRDTGHMYANGVDFSQSGGAAQTLAVNLVPGLNITPAGNGAIILSTIAFVDSALCATGGYTGSPATCPNIGDMVFTRRIVIGNSSGTAPYISAFGAPSASIMDPSGNGNVVPGSPSHSGYLNDPSAVATGFSNVITFTNSAQSAYLSEMTVTSPDFSFGGFYGVPQVSARSIF